MALANHKPSHPSFDLLKESLGREGNVQLHNSNYINDFTNNRYLQSLPLHSKSSCAQYRFLGLRRAPTRIISVLVRLARLVQKTTYPSVIAHWAERFRTLQKETKCLIYLPSNDGTDLLEKATLGNVLILFRAVRRFPLCSHIGIQNRLRLS